MLVEVIACSLADAVVAQSSGADRVELCLAIEVGGLTPYIETIEQFRDLAPFPVVVMVRPQPGGFVGQTDQILQQIDRILALRLDHLELITGVLTEANDLDLKSLAAIRKQTMGAKLVCHRCFDLTPDPFEALKQLIDLGVDRVLTSGQAPTALEGADVIAKLVERADGRIEIIAGSGIRSHNVLELIQRTGVNQVHASCFGEPETDTNRVKYGQTLRVRNEKVIDLVRATNSQNV